MTVVASPLLDYSGASGEPASAGVLVVKIAPPSPVVYSGGILSAPTASQLAPPDPGGDGGTVGYPIIG